VAPVSIALDPSFRFASPVDASAYGEYRRIHGPSAGSAAARWSARIASDGSSGFSPDPDRYTLYGSWSCPLSHRATIQIRLNGLSELVSVSYVDRFRDGRGWAFRESTGPDHVNRFALLREAYEATEAGFDGDVSIPVLWDRLSGRIVSNDPDGIDLDLATVLADLSPCRVDTYPIALRDAIDELHEEIRALSRTIPRAVYEDSAKCELRSAMAELDRRLSAQRYLLGSRITTADIRLWVLLVRFDAGPNAHGAAGPRLSTFANLWAYARDLYKRPAMRETTDFAAFAAPLTRVPDWESPTDRSGGG
jgi:putative glutathione S-transferase